MSDSLIRAAHATAEQADRLSAAFARQLAKVLRDVDREIRDWLATDPSITPRARAKVGRVVTGAGYGDLVEAATGDPFRDMAGQVVAARQAAGVVLSETEAAATRLEALRQWHLADLRDEGLVLARSIGTVVVRSRGDQRSEHLAQALDQAERRIQTLYDTAVSVFGRQVEAEHAGDDPATPFVFMGPVDAKTRDFCLDHVGKVYTREEIDQLDNGQIGDVFLTGGGYNCRHVWQEISKFSELYQTREAPEIRQHVTEIRHKKAA